MWSNLASEHARDLILGPNPRFLGMANHLRPFSGASDLSEGQEWGGGDVGGQGRFQGVKLYLGFWTCPMFWGMTNHMGPFSGAIDRHEYQEQGGGL